MTKDELTEKVCAEYEAIRSSLIDSSIPKARIQVDFLSETEISKPNQVPAYFQDAHKIRMVFLESDLDDPLAINGFEFSGQKPVWKTELLHEIIHEYQFNCVPVATEAGIQLMKSLCGNFSGPGHDEKFYTAICECADKLGLTPETLLKNI